MESQSIDMIGLRLSLADVSGDVTSVSHKVYQIMMTVHSMIVLPECFKIENCVLNSGQKVVS